jgi:hypothetical protein
MDKVNLRVVVDETPMLVVSRTQVDHMDMEGGRHLNSTTMIPELVPSRLLSVHTDSTLNSKWVKAQQLVGPRMIPAKLILESQIHQVDHHHTPTQTPMLDEPRPHHTSPQVLARLLPDLLLRPTRIRTGLEIWARSNRLLIRLSSLSPHLSPHRNCAT